MSLTRYRTLQYMGILCTLGLLAAGYWYFSVRASTTVQNTQTGNLASGLVGIWSFDGADVSGTTAYDRSGNANNGTLTNGPTITPGKLGQALNFNGPAASQYVTIADPGTGSVLDFGTGNTITLSAWVKPTGFTYANADGGVIVMKGATNDSDAANYSLISSNNAGCTTTCKASFSYTSGGGTTAHIYETNSNVLPLNTWTHLVATYTLGTAGSMVLYVNGVAQSGSWVSGTGNAAPDQSNNPLWIGADDYNGAQAIDEEFTGAIDEVRLYNRVLSAAEISSLYDLGKVTIGTRPGDDVLEEGLSAYWKLDDNTGTSATDASGNANTGTLTNGPTWTTGQIGSAVNLDGANDTIVVTDPANGSLDFGAGEPFSVSGWFYRDTSVSADTFFSKSISDVGQGYGLYMDGDLITFYLNDATVDCGWYTDINDTLTNAWHHYTLVVTGSHMVTLYLDGGVRQDRYDCSTVGDLSNSDDFVIGWGNAGGSNPFDGKIDEVRVYRRALSADEIRRLYQETHPDDPNTSLVGHWTFDGMDVSGTTAIDRGWGGNVGTLTNSPTVTPGRIGQALNFDGTDDYVSVPHSSSINLSNTISISFWEKNSATSEYNRLLAKEPGGGSSYGWAIYGNGGSLELVTSGGGPLLNGTDFGPALYDGSWHHIVWTLDNGNWTYTRDGGVITGSGTYTHGGGFGNTNPLVIGKHGVTASDYFLGVLDDVRIYNTVLTQAQITELYRSTGGKAIVASSGNDTLRSGLVGQWSMDGQDVDWSATTTEVKDDSGNANHGDATNMSAASAAPGRIGQALNFDATNDFINVGDPVALRDIEDQGGGGMSISAWIKPRSAGDRGHIVGKSNNDSGAGDGSWGLSLSATSNRLSFGHSRATQPISALINNGWVANQWEHVVVTFNGGTTASTAIQFYIDGALDATHDYDQDGAGAYVSDAGNDFLIGSGYISGSTYVFDGAIDDVRVYNRVITAAEVTQLYNLGR